MLKKLTSSIAGASVVLAIVNFLTKGIGFLRDMYIASSYGLGEELDVYLVGAVIPISLTPIFLYIGQNYLIPQFDKLKLSEDRVYKTKVISLNFFLFLILSSLVGLVLFVFSNIIIKSYLGSSEDLIQKATKIFRILLLTFPLSSIAAFYLSYLQAKFEYRFTAVSFLYLNLSMLFFLLFLQPTFGIYAIPVSYTLGNVFQVFYLVIRSKGIGKIELKYLFEIENFGLLSKSTITNIIIIESLGQLFLISDRYFYNQVSPGGLAALSYGLNLVLLPVNIFAVALSSALFPKMTYNFNRNNIVELEKNLIDGISINLFIMIPLAIVFFFFGDIVVSILFQRGKFSASNTLMIFDVIKLLGFSIIFFSAYTIFNKLLYSANKTKEILIITIIAIFVKIIGNFIFVKYYEQIGLAFAYFICYLLFFSLSYWFVVKEIKVKLGLVLFRAMSKYLTVGLVFGFLLSKFKNQIGVFSVLLPVLFVLLHFTFLYLIKDENFIYIRNLINNMKTKKEEA